MRIISHILYSEQNLPKLLSYADDRYSIMTETLFINNIFKIYIYLSNKVLLKEIIKENNNFHSLFKTISSRTTILCLRW